VFSNNGFLFLHCASFEKLPAEDYTDDREIKEISITSQSIAIICISQKLTAYYHNHPVDTGQADRIWTAIDTGLTQDMRNLTKFRNIFSYFPNEKVRTTGQILPGTPRSRSFGGLTPGPKDYILVPDPGQRIIFDGEKPDYILFMSNLMLNSHIGASSNAPMIFSAAMPLTVVASVAAAVASHPEDKECVQMQMDYVIWVNTKLTSIKIGRIGGSSCIPVGDSSKVDHWACATYDFVNSTFENTDFYETNRFK